METYKIVRMYKNSIGQSKVIHTGLTLEEAQEHCNNEETHEVKENGDVVWFDCHTKED